MNSKDCFIEEYNRFTSAGGYSKKDMYMFFDSIGYRNIYPGYIEKMLDKNVENKPQTIEKYYEILLALERTPFESTESLKDTINYFKRIYPYISLKLLYKAHGIDFEDVFHLLDLEEIPEPLYEKIVEPLF